MGTGKITCVGMRIDFNYICLRVMETMKHRVNHAQDDITVVIAELTTI